MINITNIEAGSPIQGLGYVSNSTGTTTIASFVLGAGATSSVFSFTSTAPVGDYASLNNILFSGVGNTDVNNIWQVCNTINFRNATPSYDVFLYSSRTTGGQTFYVQFYNSTGVAQTVPTITITTKSYYYTAPW